MNDYSKLLRANYTKSYYDHTHQTQVAVDEFKNKNNKKNMMSYKKTIIKKSLAAR